MAREMSFTRVLIANRGEIARRIQRACAKLGLESVATYSESDRDAPFVTEANHAICVGPPAPSRSYLNIDAILEAARAAGAGAVHPGYGFLSESAQFARRVAEAGLVFIGPSVEAIARMGSKIEAKAAAEAAGVPVLPGYRGADQSEARLLAEAESLGVPFLVKASAGGGGRGMRLVMELKTASEAIRAAKAEALAGFGDATVFLERYAPRARHVEVQILGDSYGHVVHLWDRDCSLQRNHQKLIEEAPAPGLPAPLREKMLGAAVSLARTIGYSSAGTVEYLYDSERREFYFLEMNTRLQVEHPVTEAITGIDLVEWQLRVARGEELAFTQKDIGCAGHAIEIRLAAENPAERFRPETGTITLWAPPKGPDLRLDSGVEMGSVVSHHYDSMLAKLIAKAGDREGAIRQAVAALDKFAVGGVGMNIAYQRALLTHPDFASLRHHTAALEQLFPGGWKAPEADNESRALAALALHQHLSKSANADPWHTLGAWRVTDRAGRPGAARYWQAGDELEELLAVGQDLRLEVRGAKMTPVSVEDISLRDGRLMGRVAGRPFARIAHLERTDGSWRVHLSGRDGMMQVHFLTLEDLHGHGAGAGSADEDILNAPMPGTIVELSVRQGDFVERGQTLVVLEAMKLLQSLVAPLSGNVKEIYCVTGDTVAGGAPLVRMERKEDT